MFIQNLERRFEERIQHSPGFVFNVLPKKNAEVYMSDIVKVCINCGPLLLDKTVFRKINGVYGAQCRKCISSYHKKAYQKQKELHKNQLESGEFSNINPAKTCKVHGELTSDQIQLRGKYKKCRLCMYKNKQRWEKENFQKVNEGKVKRYYKDPKKRSEERVLGRRNITQEIYYKMFEDQNYTCAICKITKGLPISRANNNEWPLCIDHCHKTNRIRKLLCRQCNTMLGNAKDSTDILQEAINYLKGFKDDNEGE
jgi:hypothetical protein